jgi:hypothetical protein
VNLAREAVAVEPVEPLGAVVEVEAEEEVLVLPPPHAVARRATPISGRAMKRPTRLGRETPRCISVTKKVHTTEMKRLREKLKSFLRSLGVLEGDRSGWRHQ